MPDPTAPRRSALAKPATPPNVAGRIVELKVSGNLMTLDAGLFCLFQQPGVVVPPQDGSGLPGVRISVPPRMHTDGRTGAGQGDVTIRGLHEDGWLGLRDGAALVRVTGAPAQILITVYQSPDHPADTAPRLQVVPLSGPAAAMVTGQGPVPSKASGQAPGAVAPASAAQAGGRSAAVKAVAGHEVIAHLERTGDVGVKLGEWLGNPGSGKWIEGFGISPRGEIAPDEIEYQAVLGRGWLSPWMTDGKFCGSRGMALPMLGFNLRLRGKAAERYDCHYSASFVDGTRIGPLPAGRSCEAPSLSPLEAFQVILRPRGAAASARAKAAPVAPKKAAAKKPTIKPAARAAAKPQPPAPTKPPAKRAVKKPMPPARKRGR